MGEENYADYRDAILDPSTVHGMLEDYRAGIGIDRAHETEDRRAGRGIDCGHHMAEEAPEVLANELASFLQQ
ncbi:hypothetical protein LVJ94_05610 [Pendulispora rubella]|uniref:Uncharacterized protein n=1 Tax=Pendulispora rubella TaxID=2741070 RepID=A0ABZ2L717_9BACT